MTKQCSISAEFRVLLAACATRSEERELPSPINWNRVHELSEMHGVLPLVHDYLQRGGLSSNIPQSMEHEAHEYAKRQLRLSAILLQLLECFDRSGIDGVPFKGPVLAQQLYGNLALRQSIDLDVLVARDQIDEALRVLRESGLEEQDEFSHSERSLMRGSHCEIELHSSDWDVTVELHWAVLPPEFGVTLPSAAGLHETQWLSLCGKSVPILRHEENVLVLAAHATKHCWNRLLFIADLVRAIRIPELDHDRLYRLAKESRCMGMLAFGLELSSRLLAAPRELSQRFPLSSSAAKYVDITIAKLLSGKADDADHNTRHMLYLALLDDRIQATRYCWRVIANPQPIDLAQVRFPRQLAFLYSAVRSVRLASKAVRALIPAR